MSLKAVELQIAIPRTSEAGRYQKRIRPQKIIRAVAARG